MTLGAVRAWYDATQSNQTTQVFMDEAGQRIVANVQCCSIHEEPTGPLRGMEAMFVDVESSKWEPEFVFRLCSTRECSRIAAEAAAAMGVNGTASATPPPAPPVGATWVTPEEAQQLAAEVQDLFAQSFNMYMTHAWPEDELAPLTCTGRQFEPTGGSMLTLIDSLDSLAVIGNWTAFKHGVALVQSSIASFDLNQNVSVFETNIRVLGGLLSAHAILSLPEVYPEAHMPEYHGQLLWLAQDLGNRLMPAFRTRTGIPYGTVNLRHGVPPGESMYASTAGAGTLSLEFEYLSHLTGNMTYGEAGRKALTELYHRRSKMDMVGKHIHISTGSWIEPVSGVGSNSDSFYEYLLKSYEAFGNVTLWNMFVRLHDAVQRHGQRGPWIVDVDMNNANVVRAQAELLGGFWPGMQVLAGKLSDATYTLNGYMRVWERLGFFPENLEVQTWMPGVGGAQASYQLRPEIAESVYHLFTATQDRGWQAAGRSILRSLQKLATPCGVASVEDITTGTLADHMPSFFLSETLKYLYLLFSHPNNIVTRTSTVFTTEAHLFPVGKWWRGRRQPGRTSKRPRSQPRYEDCTAAGCMTLLFPPTCPLPRMGAYLSFLSEIEWAALPHSAVPTHPAAQQDVIVEPQISAVSTSFGDLVLANAPQFFRVSTKNGMAVSLHHLGAAPTHVLIAVSEGPRAIDLVRLDSEGQMSACAVHTYSGDGQLGKRMACVLGGFGRNLAADPIWITGPVVNAVTSLGCDPPHSPTEYAGKIVLVLRGNCAFEDKVAAAGAGGAAGVVIGNYDDTHMVMSATGEHPPESLIPAVLVGSTDFRALQAGVTVGMSVSLRSYNARCPIIMGHCLDEAELPIMAKFQVQVMVRPGSFEVHVGSWMIHVAEPPGTGQRLLHVLPSWRTMRVAVEPAEPVELTPMPHDLLPDDFYFAVTQPTTVVREEAAPTTAVASSLELHATLIKQRLTKTCPTEDFWAELAATFAFQRQECLA